MKFLTVAAAVFASTSLAVPTNNHNGGGACVPRPDPGNSNTSSAPGTKPTDGNTSSAPGTKPADGNTSSTPGTKPTGSHTSSTPATKPTGSHTSSTPATKPTDGHTSSGPGPKPTGSNTSSGPGTKPTSSHTNSVPATTTTGSNTGSHTSSGPSTTSNGHPGGEFHCPTGLYSNPQCCSADVLGLVSLDCASPNQTPASGDDFKSICAAIGKQAKCCVLPVAGQDVLCQDIITGGNPSVGNPTSVPGGNPTSVPGGNPTSVPGGNPTSVPGGHPTSVPGGNPTSVPGGNPTSVPGGNPPPPSDGITCPRGLYSSPQCCATDVLGVASLNCFPPKRIPTSESNFISVCATDGQQAKCCVLSLLGQAILCQDPIPDGHPTSVPGGHPTSVPGGHPTSVPGGHPTSVPGGHPTSVPGGHPTSVPGGNPTSVSVPGGHPTSAPGGNYRCPSSLYSNPQCCATDVLGVADLNCSSPSGTPTSRDNFDKICAAVGQQAKCCVLPLLGQGVLCTDPV